MSRTEEIRNDKGLIHSTESPAVFIYGNDGLLYHELWFFNGNQFNITGGPSHISYYKTGKILCHMWTDKNGLHHREKYPAIVAYTKTGKIYRRMYWWNGVNITPTIKSLFKKVPNELSKNQIILLKLSLPDKFYIDKFHANHC